MKRILLLVFAAVLSLLLIGGAAAEATDTDTDASSDSEWKLYGGLGGCN